MSNYSGANWIEETLGLEMSEFGKKVADLLGDVYLGIYHLTMKSLSVVDWTNEDNICIVVPSYLSTFDDNKLTMLVLFAHDRMIRIEIEGARLRYLRLIFSNRTTRDRGAPQWQRHPTIEEHIALLRDHFKDRYSAGE